METLRDIGVRVRVCYDVMSPADENRLYDLTRKQKTTALSSTELDELYRLTHKKAQQTKNLDQAIFRAPSRPAEKNRSSGTSRGSDHA